MVINSKNSHFEIAGKIKEEKLNFIMKVNNEKYINTKFIPLTIPVLSNDLPSIFTCECFNNENKSFGEECKNTELGHLFEHIMLEYLCIEKLEREGDREAIYEGNTSWNWINEKRGTFNIEISVGEKDKIGIQNAFAKSIKLLEKMLG